MANESPIVITRAVRTNRDSLAMVAHVCIILLSVGYFVEQVRQIMARAADTAVRPPEVGEIEEHSSSSASAAHITFTNLNSFPAETCVRGVIEEKKLKGKAYSAPVCTGEMKPRTTITLEAPYRVGDIESLCSGDPDRFGNTHLDWSKCTFTTEKVSKK